MKTKMRPITIHTKFLNRETVLDPEVVFRTTDSKGNPTTDVKILNGSHCRVIPSSAKEVFLLRMLDHCVDKFAPTRGNGIILTNRAISILDA